MFEYVISALIALALAVYLVHALLRPDRY
ncbi:K(+)-transporting ATPase subunit F [Janibacter sp. GXQ6167]